MSQLSDNASVLIAHASERLASGLIKQAASDSGEAIVIGLSGAIPQIMIVAGILSKSFPESAHGAHPVSCCDENSILLASLILARSAMPKNGGCGIHLSPETYADAIADFAKLKPLVSVDSFVRADVLAVARDNQGVDGGELLAGILSKRITN